MADPIIPPPPPGADWTAEDVIMVDGVGWLADRHHTRRADAPQPGPQAGRTYLRGADVAGMLQAWSTAAYESPSDTLVCDAYAPILRYGRVMRRRTVDGMTSLWVWRDDRPVAVIMPAAAGRARAGDASPHGGTFRRVADLVTALRVTVDHATIRRIEALGFEPGSGDIVVWLCDEIDRLRALVPTPDATP